MSSTGLSFAQAAVMRRVSPDTSSQLDQIEKGRRALMLSIRSGHQTAITQRLANDIEGLVQEVMDELIDSERQRTFARLKKVAA